MEHKIISDIAGPKLNYAAPQRVRLDEASRLTGGIHTSLCDVLGSGRHNETPDASAPESSGAG
jgi:hypothetical protein